MLTRVLCRQPEPPPPNIDLQLDPVEANTTRQRVEAFTAPSRCQTCHRDIDGVGFAFEHYDAAGRWRDTEDGCPIDSSGRLYVTDAAGPFVDAPQLMGKLAESEDAKACFVSHWLERAYRRAAAPEDACALEELQRRFNESDGDLADVMVALAESDNFRYRLKSELLARD